VISWIFLLSILGSKNKKLGSCYTEDIERIQKLSEAKRYCV